ncbi:hypothetical protein ES703_124126 [subsurface metagenome]
MPLFMASCAISFGAGRVKLGMSDTEIKSLINTDKAISLEQFIDSEKAKTLQQRGDELLKQGLSKKEILKTLRSEGY